MPLPLLGIPAQVCALAGLAPDVVTESGRRLSAVGSEIGRLLGVDVGFFQSTVVFSGTSTVVFSGF